MSSQNVLLRVSGFILLIGLFFFFLWSQIQLDWLLWVSGLGLSIFLILPAVLLIFWQDMAILYLNSMLALFFRPQINPVGEPVNMGPPPRLIEKRKWNHLSGGEQIWVILGVCLITALGLVVMRYTFGPALVNLFIQ